MSSTGPPQGILQPLAYPAQELLNWEHLPPFIREDVASLVQAATALHQVLSVSQPQDATSDIQTPDGRATPPLQAAQEWVEDACMVLWDLVHKSPLVQLLQAGPCRRSIQCSTHSLLASLRARAPQLAAAAATPLADLPLPGLQRAEEEAAELRAALRCTPTLLDLVEGKPFEQLAGALAGCLQQLDGSGSTRSGEAQLDEASQEDLAALLPDLGRTLAEACPFTCLLTGRLLREPVILARSGRTYERRAIEWQPEAGSDAGASPGPAEPRLLPDPELERAIRMWLVQQRMTFDEADAILTSLQSQPPVPPAVGHAAITAATQDPGATLVLERYPVIRPQQAVAMTAVDDSAVGAFHVQALGRMRIRAQTASLASLTMMQQRSPGVLPQPLLQQSEWPSQQQQGSLMGPEASESAASPAVRSSAQHSVDPNTQNQQTGVTPLHIACHAGHVAVVEHLLGVGADALLVDKADRTALWHASYAGHAPVVALLLQQQLVAACEDAGDIDGMTALHVASYQGHAEVAQLLLGAGADVNAKDAEGCTPLYLASHNGQPRVVEVLCHKGARVDEAERVKGWTALHAVSSRRRLPLGGPQKGGRLVRVSAQADVKARAEVAEMLIAGGANIEARAQGPQPGKLGVTPLLLACRSGAVEVARVLVQHGAALEAADEHGRTPLWNACFHGHMDIVELLLGVKVPPDVDAPDADARTPLMAACADADLELVRRLLQADASLERQDKAARTALHLACTSGSEPLVRLLLDWHVNMECLKLADEDGCTPLHFASVCSATAVVELLLAKGADPWATNKADQTPLQAARASKAAGDAKDLHALLEQAGARKGAGTMLYTILPGEDAWQLEERWGLEHGTIQRLNPALDMSNIPAYHPLTVPATVDAGVADPADTAAASTTNRAGNSVSAEHAPAAPNSQGTKVYKVMPGEYAWQLEERWGLEHGTIQRLNPGLDLAAIPSYHPLVVPGSVDTGTQQAGPAGSTRAVAASGSSRTGGSALPAAGHQEATSGAQRPAPSMSRTFTLAPGDDPYQFCAREFGDGMLYLTHMYYQGHRLTRQSARNLPNGAILEYRGATPPPTGGSGGGGGANRGAVPHEFRCPITLMLMRDPVLASSGHTYERAAIERHLTRSSNDPVTGAPLASKEVKGVITLRTLIKDWLATSGLSYEQADALELQEAPAASGAAGSSSAAQAAAGEVAMAATSSHAAQQGQDDQVASVLSSLGPWELEIRPEELQLGQQLRVGGFSGVYRATCRGSAVAVKLMAVGRMSQQELQACKREILVMCSLRHPNVVQLLGVCALPPAGSTLAVVMELAAKDSLYDMLHRPRTASQPVLAELNPTRRLNMARDIARGLSFLHGLTSPVVHGDIKSPNCLVMSDWSVKLCDFGLSTRKPQRSAALPTSAALPHAAVDAMGAPPWAAPEVLRGEAATERSDIYSLGCVLYELVTSQTPWHHLPQASILATLSHLVGIQGQRPELPEGVDERLARLIRRCWHQDPAARPTAAQVLALLECMSELVHVEHDPASQVLAPAPSSMPPLDQPLDHNASLAAASTSELQVWEGSLQEPFKGHPYYKQGAELRRDCNSDVFLAHEQRSGKQCEVLCIDRRGMKVRAVTAMVTDLLHLSGHPNVIALQEVFLTTSHLCIVTEHASYGTLHEYISKHMDARKDAPRREKMARWLFQQLVFAIDYCAIKGELCRGITLCNILLFPNAAGSNAPICKIGPTLTQCHERHDSGHDTTTWPYLAPEIFIGDKDANGLAADIWSCGVVLYAMLTAQLPFGHADSRTEGIWLVQRILQVQFKDPSAIEHCSAGARDLLKRIFVADPAHRIDLDSVFSHPWFVEEFGGKPGAPVPPLHQINRDICNTELEACGLQSEDELRTMIQQAADLRPQLDDGELAILDLLDFE